MLADAASRDLAGKVDLGFLARFWNVDQSVQVRHVVIDGDLQRRKAGFDFQSHRPGSFGRLERALRLPVYLKVIAVRFGLPLLRPFLLRRHRICSICNLLCWRSEMALRQNPLLLAMC